MAPPAPRFDLRLRVAGVLLVVYVVAARLVHNFFPLSVFDMYQAHPPELAARVVVRDATGETSELDTWDAFVCEGPALTPATIERQCGADHRPLPYVVRDQSHLLDDRAGSEPGPEAITIVSRAHRVGARDRTPAVPDCALLQCTAHRRRDVR